MAHSFYQAQFQPHLDDKNSFLNDIKGINNEASAKIEFARNKAKQHDYGFVATNKILIEQEFNHLFSSLKEKGLETNDFYFYCYYCCLMMKYYYQVYQQDAKAAEYQKWLDDLTILCQGNKLPVTVMERKGFFTALKQKISADIGDLIETPKKLSKLRDKVAISNLNRIYWFFCRTTIKNSLLLARDLKWLEKLGNILGKEVNVDDAIHILEKPNGVLRFLSVGFFAIRFIMNAGMLLKHTAFPSEEEKKLDWKKRFSNEMYKRHATFLNDIVWGTVNCVTNYNELFGISAPVAGWVVAGFLLFDVCLLLWRRHLEEKEYLTKRSQYLIELGALEKNPLDARYILLTEQLRQLDLTWQTNSATWLFNASAAFMLMAGFSVSMLLTPPVLILSCYMVCTLAVAMYLSDGAYRDYKEKSLILEHAQLTGVDEVKALQQYKTARNDFAFTLTKNAVVPALLIGTLAVCWQAALALAIVYAGYEIYRSYTKHQQVQAETQIPSDDNMSPVYS